VTNAVFLGSPAPLGFEWTPYAIAGGYGTPIVLLSSIYFQTLDFVGLR